MSGKILRQKIIEVFKTNVDDPMAALTVIRTLQRHVPDGRVDIDLEDCDKVLRVEGENFTAAEIAGLVKNAGFECTELE